MQACTVKKNITRSIRAWAVGLCAVVALLAVPLTATGAIIPFQASLDSAQAGNPPVGLGVGSATGEFDTDTLALSLDTTVLGIELSELLGVVEGSPYHIHVGAPGVNGPIIVILGVVGNWFELGNGLDGIGLDFMGMVDPLVADDFVENLLTENLYLNLHTTGDPSGQIRGQILVPEPTSFALIGLGLGLAFVSQRRRRA